MKNLIIELVCVELNLAEKHGHIIRKDQSENSQGEIIFFVTILWYTQFGVFVFNSSIAVVFP